MRTVKVLCLAEHSCIISEGEQRACFSAFHFSHSPAEYVMSRPSATDQPSHDEKEETVVTLETRTDKRSQPATLLYTTTTGLS